MIERHWKGLAKKEEAENYIEHLRTETFPSIKAIDGFIRATILKRPVDKGMEFLVITVWDSMEAIRQFAGEQAGLAVVPDTVQKMMISYDTHVSHFEHVLDFGHRL
jgi:heme-degrading monooxygenase HmoA